MIITYRVEISITNARFLHDNWETQCIDIILEPQLLQFGCDG